MARLDGHGTGVERSMKILCIAAVAASLALLTTPVDAQDEGLQLRCMPYVQLLQYLHENNMKLIVVGLPEVPDILEGKGTAIQFWKAREGEWLVSMSGDRESCILGGGRSSLISIGRPAKPILRHLEASEENPKKLTPQNRKLIDEILRKPN